MVKKALVAAIGLSLAVAACSAAPDDTSNVDETAALADELSGGVPNGTHLMTTAALNLRTGPSTSDSIILVIPNGAEVTAVSGTPQNGFYNVQFGTHTGYSYGAYLAKVSDGSLSCGHVQWWTTALTYGPNLEYGWWDTDLAVSHDTPVQLRHDSRLYKTGVYGWGYMPEFVDLVTGDKFRFLHLRPQHQLATNVGQVYRAGTVVGYSGGDTKDTGLGQFSTGAHLCVQTITHYRTAFPYSHDACN